MRLLHSIRTITIALALMYSFPAAAQSASLDSLPAATQDEISRICLPVQFREGASAYRNCVQAELGLRSNSGASELGKLSFDDKYAVQQACAKAGGQSSANYQSCVSDQITSLSRIAAPELDKLSEDELYVVQQSCFDAQSKQGAASYRTCLNGEVQSLLAIPAADTSNLNMLKKNALQLRCSSTSSNAVQYRQCVAAEYESIAGVAPSFLPVSTATRVQSTASNRTNNSNVNTAVETVAEQSVKPAPAKAVVPDPEASAPVAVSSTDASPSKPTMALPRNIKPPQNAELAVTDTPALLNVEPLETPAAAEPALPANTESNTIALLDVANDTLAENPALSPQNDLTAADARVISRPKLVETLELQARAKAQGIELEPINNEPVAAATPATPTEQAESGPMLMVSNAWQKFLDALASLDGLGWLIIAGVLAMPALLLSVFSLVKRFKKSDTFEPTHNPSLTDRIEPGMQTRKVRHEQEAAAMFDDTPPVEHDAITRIATKSERSKLQPGERFLSVDPEEPAHSETWEEAISSGNSAFSGHGWQSAFGHRLMQLPEADRMETCIEFLIYWVAYGDDRYQPDLKKRLFTATQLSSHDEIKRWVLKQDVFAFSDVVVWLRTNASQTQLDQCIALIMSLLVTEHNVTPVQNTVLRFLSDAFNIGKDQFERRFEKAFGHALPPVPRPDKYAWWAKQEADITQQWDARAMALKPETEQMIARLGLPATYDEIQVINAFRRAARRCHPDRFSELGERERALAEQQFIKFEQARDKLLGVSV